MGIANLSNGFGAGGSSGAAGAAVDNLTSTSVTSALSANQGRVLNDKIEAAAIGAALPVTADGQTALTLPATPKNAASVILEINGVDYRNPHDFTVSGTTVTWLNGFILKTTDIIFAKEFT